MKRKFIKIYSFFLVFLLAVSVGRGFFSLWFKQNGFSYPQIAAYYLIKLTLPVIILLLIKEFSTVKSISLALISEIILMLTVYRFYHPWQIFFLGLPSSLTVVLFYVTYNTLHFKYSPQDKRAFSASLFGLAGPFLGVIVPPLAGFFGQRWGLASLFLVATFILLVCLYLIRFLPRIKFQSNLFRILKKTKKINSLLIIQGIKDSVPLLGIPLFTLFFINQPLPYGVYFGYLGFVSMAASVSLGYLSDKSKKRTIFLYPANLIVALVIITLAFSRNLASWAIITGILGIISTINDTFVTALVLDQIPRVETGMIGREFFLAVGRGIGSLIILLSLSFSLSPQIAFFFIGFLYLLFPILICLKKLYPKQLAL